MRRRATGDLSDLGSPRFGELVAKLHILDLRDEVAIVYFAFLFLERCHTALDHDLDDTMCVRSSSNRTLIYKPIERCRQENSSGHLDPSPRFVGREELSKTLLAFRSRQALQGADADGWSSSTDQRLSVVRLLTEVIAMPDEDVAKVPAREKDAHGQETFSASH
jgi:hypothetical protein